MSKTYTENFIRTVLRNSDDSECWEAAVQEWSITDVIEDEELESTCICGKEHLRYLYTIRNDLNGNVLFPIGSKCIKKFNRTDLDEYTATTERLFQLLHAVRNNEFIDLSSKYFSRKLLRELYEQNVFPPNDYNDHNGYKDYKFLLDMFNKRDMSKATNKQQRKIRYLVAFTIRPYLETLLGEKIKH